jgi:hypothetical protein
MDAKDILRLALFVFFFAMALRSGLRIRVPGSVKINSTAETEDRETQQLLQRLKDTRGKIKQEPNEYENKNILQEVNDTGRAVADPANIVSLVIVLLMV